MIDVLGAWFFSVFLFRVLFVEGRRVVGDFLEGVPEGVHAFLF